MILAFNEQNCFKEGFWCVSYEKENGRFLRKRGKNRNNASRRKHIDKGWKIRIKIVSTPKNV